MNLTETQVKELIDALTIIKANVERGDFQDLIEAKECAIWCIKILQFQPKPKPPTPIPAVEPGSEIAEDKS